MATLIERLTDMFNQGYYHYVTWYRGADPLTQYLVLTVSAGALFLVYIIFLLSRLTK